MRLLLLGLSFLGAQDPGVLLQALERVGQPRQSAPGLLRQLLEERLTSHPSVVSLAAELGYSTRTLDRACQAAAGRTAKQLLDERISLEVRRLLTHTTRPISQIGAELGFDDPSNFSKFVRRQLGSSPRDVRQRPDDRATQVTPTR